MFNATRALVFVAYLYPLSLVLAAPAAVGQVLAPATAATLGLMQGAPPPESRLVTIETFYTPPYNRWSFLNVREIFPTRPVSASVSPWVLPREPVELANVDVELGNGRNTTVGDWLRSAYTDGFIVLHRGNVVHEQYENGQTPATPHIMFSVTKSFTGTLMLLLEADGKVDLSESVAHYLPELAESAFGDASVQQLMDMTNSIQFDETYADPNSDWSRFAAAFKPGSEGVYAYLSTLKRKNPRFDHGEAFHYVTPDPEVLAWIIRRVSGHTLSSLMHSRIWSKLGTEYEANYLLDPKGEEKAGGGLSMTLRDAARFGQMILDDGKAGDERVIPVTLAERIKTPRNQAVFNAYYADPWYGNVASDYHDQWWSYKDANAVVALGIHGQFIYINSQYDVVIVKQSSDPDAESDRVDSETPLVLHAIAQHLGTR